MCDVCRSEPCHPMCPNASDPPAVYVCSGCGDSILDGDYYWDFFGEQYCEECIRSERKEAVYDPD